MRKVQVSKRQFNPRGTGKPVVERVDYFKGWFHEWGEDFVGEAGDRHKQTAAIVEDASGQIHTIEPELIKFLDPIRFGGSDKSNNEEN